MERTTLVIADWWEIDEADVRLAVRLSRRTRWCLEDSARVVAGMRDRFPSRDERALEQYLFERMTREAPSW